MENKSKYRSQSVSKTLKMEKTSGHTNSYHHNGRKLPHSQDQIMNPFLSLKLIRLFMKQNVLQEISLYLHLQTCHVSPKSLELGKKSLSSSPIARELK